MAQRVYATRFDYYEFIGETPDPMPVVEKDLDASLRRASSQVESHVRTAVYATDDDGYPTDVTVSDALRDATCAYVAYWDETGDVTGAGAIAGPMKIGSVSLGGTATGGASSRTPADTRRSDEAITILRNAGLISSVAAH
jgi:hypothetical protein